MPILMHCLITLVLLRAAISVRKEIHVRGNCVKKMSKHSLHVGHAPE